MLFPLLVALCCAHILSAQTTESSPDTLRVTVTINADGSRTTFESDPANHKAVATTSEHDGKLRGTIRYALDDAGRYASGEIYGPDGQLRFKAVYKYDGAGRLTQELQLGKDGATLHKIIYGYDAIGRQISYSVYDAAGKLISQTLAPNVPAKGAKKGKIR